MQPVYIGKESLPEGFAAGNGSVGTSETPLVAVSVAVRKHVTIRANAGNSGTISFGPKNRSNAGFILAAGDTSPPIYVEDAKLIYLIGSDVSQAYSWLSN